MQPLNVKEVDSYVSTFQQDTDGSFLVGFLIRVVTEATNIKTATERVQALAHQSVNFSALQTKIRRTYQEFKKLRSHNLKLESNNKALLRFLSAPFAVPSSALLHQNTPAPSTCHPSTRASLLPPNTTTSAPAAQAPHLNEDQTSLLPPAPGPLLPLPPVSLPPIASAVRQPPAPALLLSPAPVPPFSPHQASLQPLSSKVPSPLPPSTTPCSTSETGLTSAPLAHGNVLRKDCQLCSERRRQLQNSCSLLRRQLREKKLEISQLRTHYQVKKTNLFKKRKTNQLEEKKRIIQEQAQKIVALEKQLSSQELQISTQADKIKKLEEKTKTLQRRVQSSLVEEADLKELKKKVLKLERDLKNATHATSESSASDLETRQDGKTYNDKLRRVIYHCLMSQVPVESAGPVVQYTIKTIVGRKLTSLPDPSTVAQMALEMGVLSDLQVGELFRSAPVINLAWDATTLDGRHLNQIHVSSIKDSLTLTTQEIPGGTAADYANQIVAALKNVEKVYADFTSIDLQTIQASFRSKILSTLTDRAAANHATVVLLEERLNVDLLELKCHLHPLDGLANAARSRLKELDREHQKSSNSYGADCCAANVLYAISKLRYKAKGDPTSFKSFLRSRGKAAGMFIRFVGNRLHVLFHLAGMVFLHQDLLKEYLEAYCNAAALGAAVLKDLKDDYIQVHLCALGWMGKIITGPWMALIYTPMLERTHLLMVKYLKVCVQRVGELVTYPDSLFTTESDIFGKPLVEDDTLLALRRAVPSDELLSTISSLATTFKVLLLRQLDTYLSGQLSDPSLDVERRASAAPVHNIWAERCLGMVDSQVKRAPNATIRFVDSKVRCKMNHTLDWLERKSPTVQTAMICYAVKGAAVKRKEDRQRQLELEEELIRRMKEKGQKRDKALRNRLGRQIKSAFSEDGLGLDDQVFSNLNSQISGFLRNSVSQPDRLVGLKMSHVWNLDNKDVLYMGFVQGVKTKRKVPELTVAYWLHPEESRQDSVDYKLTLHDFLTDIVLGDLQIVN